MNEVTTSAALISSIGTPSISVPAGKHSSTIRSFGGRIDSRRFANVATLAIVARRRELWCVPPIRREWGMSAF